MSDIEPLDDDLRALLGPLRDVPELPHSEKDALFARVASRLPIDPGDGGGEGNEGGGGESTSSRNPPLGGAAPSGGASALASAWTSMVVATTFVLGVGVGVALDRNLLPASARPVVTVDTPPQSNAAASLAVSFAPSATTAVIPVESLPSVANASSTPRVALRAIPSTDPDALTSRGLAAERALLDVSRAALAGGAPAEALAAAERHARSYPNGALAEEREVMAIRALVALGRRSEARVRATEFEQQHPRALGLSTVRSLVQEP